MKPSTRSVRVERIYSLPEVIWIEGQEYQPDIKHFVLQSGTLWASGGQVLLRSEDGINWQNLAANLCREGNFYVSSVVKGATDLRIFARSRSGLRCYRWDEWELVWKVLFTVPTSSPGVFSSWTESGLIMAAKQNPETEIMCRTSDAEDRLGWRSVLNGSATHLQMSFSGNGLCALWGIDREPPNWEWSTSAIYSTNDSGQNWRMVATMETMLLAGALIDVNTTLVRGTDGTLALVDKAGLQELWREDGGDIVAIDANGSRQIAVIESDDEPPAQSLLFREGRGKWTRYSVRFDDRVQCISLTVPGECVVGTRQAIYRCRFE